MDVDGVGRAHCGDNHVAQVDPALIAEHLKQGQHGCLNVVKVETAGIAPDPRNQQGRVLLARPQFQVHFGQKKSLA